MKTLFTIIAHVFVLSCYSQLGIIKDCENIKAECSLYANQNLVIANKQKTKGFTLCPSFIEKNGKFVMDGLMVYMLNIGTCCENNELVILLADSTIITLVSWNKFNCEGNAWYDLNADELKAITTQKILKAEIQNGYSYEKFTGEIVADKQDYFIYLYQQLQENKFVKK